jgi:hypothetical protein
MAELGTDNGKSEQQSTSKVYKHLPTDTVSVTQQLTARSQQLTPDKLTTKNKDRYFPTTKTNNRPPTNSLQPTGRKYNKNRLEATAPSASARETRKGGITPAGC